jgi:hypothetical protein
LKVFRKIAEGMKSNSAAAPGESGLEGVVTFFGAHHALKGEKMLSSAGISAVLIPGPREISPNCGTALRFDFERKTEAERVLTDNNVLYEAIHFYPEKRTE